MRKEYVKIHNIPTIIWGEPSTKVYLSIHGQGGNKEEAKLLYDSLTPSTYQVISIDLPQHGQRKEDGVAFLPWKVLPELKKIMQYIHLRWDTVSLYATSIGALFSMMCYEKEKFEKVLLVSPILDMQYVIMDMLKQNNISEERLQKEQTIPTSGEILSWQYLCYIREHPITNWPHQTNILYAKKDLLIPYHIAKDFCERFNCQLTIIEEGVHWFYTEEQLHFLKSWLKKYT